MSNLGLQNSANKSIRYSEAFKRKVVSDINQGLYSVLGAMRKYQIGGNMTVYKWLAKYNSAHKMTSRGSSMEKKEKSSGRDLYARIRHLEQVVSDLSIENKLLKTTIEIADETYHMDLKKNFAKASLTGSEKKKNKKS